MSPSLKRRVGQHSLLLLFLALSLQLKAPVLYESAQVIFARGNWGVLKLSLEVFPVSWLILDNFYPGILDSDGAPVLPVEQTHPSLNTNAEDRKTI